MIIAPSRHFAAELTHDYSIAESRLRVIANPIDLKRFSPSLEKAPRQGPVVLLFVARMSVRKGLEMVVDLSNRLADLEGRVIIKVAGDRTLWSDYRPLLRGLNPKTSTYLGRVPAERLAQLYREADALIQPSHYEPFALTVGEGLASGLPVVASEAVGAAEQVNRDCCSVFPVADRDRFESSVRELLARLRSNEQLRLSRLAREEAERLFNPDRVGQEVAAVLREASALRGSPSRDDGMLDGNSKFAPVENALRGRANS